MPLRALPGCRHSLESGFSATMRIIVGAGVVEGDAVLVVRGSPGFTAFAVAHVTDLVAGLFGVAEERANGKPVVRVVAVACHAGDAEGFPRRVVGELGCEGAAFASDGAVGRHEFREEPGELIGVQVNLPSG